MFNMSQTINNLRTHQSQYVKLSDVSNSVVSTRVRKVEILSLVLNNVRRPEKDYRLQKHRLITRKIPHLPEISANISETVQDKHIVTIRATD